MDSTQANAIRRDHFMYVPANAGPTERAQVADLVAVTDIVLRRYNPYIKDYQTMMEIFESDGAANAKFASTRTERRQTPAREHTTTSKPSTRSRWWSLHSGRRGHRYRAAQCA